MSQNKNEQMEEEEIESLEEKNINEEYKIWKKNSAFLYDLVLTHALEWPSLTVEWLPFKEEFKEKDCSEQKILLGTHTSQGEQNYLMIGKVVLPLEDTEIDVKKYDSKRNEIGGFGSGSSSKAKIEIIQRINHDGEVNKARYCPQKPTLIASKSPSPTIFLFDYTKHSSSPSNDICSPELKLKGHKKGKYFELNLKKYLI